ncbi:MAG: peptidylprolyl isomerase [Sphingobacteriales bacterium]|nr:MAG: peptidylprolyl isomerase [Sphingobacteriales bacterium]
MRKLCLLALLFSVFTAFAQPDVKIRKKDRRRDIALVTTEGTIVLRLSDATPIHRDNFLKLVKSGYYDSMLFHRVIPTFMIQTGDPNSKSATPVQTLGSGGPGYTVPAEFRPFLFHKRGALAAARMGDDVNPQRASSGSHFYIVHGKSFSDGQLDSIETKRLKGIKLPPAHREVYKKDGGTPQLDQYYTVFGEVVRGMDVVDAIAQTAKEGPEASLRTLS